MSSSWTREENDILRQGVAEGKSVNDIAHLLPGRSVAAIKRYYEEHLHPNIIQRPFTQSDLELLLYYRFKGVTFKNMVGLVYTDEDKGFSPNRLKETMDKLQRVIGGAKTFEEARTKLRQSKGLPTDTEPTDVLERASKMTSTYYNRRMVPPKQPATSQPATSQPKPSSSSSSEQQQPAPSQLSMLASVASVQQPVRRSKPSFTPEEDQDILDAVALHGTDDWELIASFVPSRTAGTVRERYERNLRTNVVDRPFTEEDDELLLYYYYRGIGYTHMYGLVATDHTSGRSTSRLRDRWRTNLQPIIKGSATYDEARTRLREYRGLPLDEPSTVDERAQAAYAAEPVVKQAAMKRMMDDSAGPATKRRLRSEEVQMVKLIMSGHTPIQIAEIMGMAYPKVVELRTKLMPHIGGSVEESLERLRHI